MTDRRIRSQAVEDDRRAHVFYRFRASDRLLAADPRDWTGPKMKGRHFSECPADYLDLLADRFDYFAQQSEEKDERTDKGKPVAPYKRLDAARARGWAKRIRGGWVHTAEPTRGWGEPPDDQVDGF